MSIVHRWHFLVRCQYELFYHFRKILHKSFHQITQSYNRASGLGKGLVEIDNNPSCRSLRTVYLKRPQYCLLSITNRLVFSRGCCVNIDRTHCDDSNPPSNKKLPCFDIPTHYNDVIMGTIAFQITSLTIVYSTVYSDADQRKHQSYASLAFVRGIHRDRWIPRTNGQ